jgi:hypothetical protein
VALNATARGPSALDHLVFAIGVDLGPDGYPTLAGLPPERLSTSERTLVTILPFTEFINSKPMFKIDQLQLPGTDSIITASVLS